MKCHAIYAEGLVKRFGDTVALAGLDLAVPSGTVQAVLGPNGAGKTTMVRILATLLRPDGGSAKIAGIEVAEQPEKVRRMIRLTGQFVAVDQDLTGYENLMLVGRLLGLSRTAARRRTAELLERFDLASAGSRLSKTYSGGMRRRLDLALSLITVPEVLFLDEPTTGLDPSARKELWAIVRDLVLGGTTVLLTTQDLDEADRLAHHIAVVDHGRVVESGTPAELKAKVGGQTLEVRLADRADLDLASVIMTNVVGKMPLKVEDGDLSAALEPDVIGSEALSIVARELHLAGIDITELGLRLARLDDVFMALTGRPADKIGANE